MTMNFSQETRNEIRIFTIERLEPLLDRFKTLIKMSDEVKWTDQDWILFCCFSLNSIGSRMVEDQKKEGIMFDSEKVLKIVLQNQNVLFLIEWLTSNVVCKDQNFKDRKNSFFRLINKELKKKLKKSSNNDQGNLLKNMQQSLNHNTISSKQIKEYQEKWGKQICQYLDSDDILEDIISKNKSKGRYYYILHLSQIKYFASINRLSEFPFYQKTCIKNSFQKIIRTLCQLEPETKQIETILFQGQCYSSQKNDYLQFIQTNSLSERCDENLFSVLDLDIIDPGWKNTLWVQKSMTFLPNI